MSSGLGPGAEPGVNPRTQGTSNFYSHIHEECEIEVVDYSSTRVQVTQYDNKGDVLVTLTHKPRVNAE